jgi:dienelactone hydrolase
MPTQTRSFNFSPSIVHHRRLGEIEPELAYDGGEVAAWQRKLRRKVRQLTGYDQMPQDKCPLNVRSLWRREHPLGTIEKLVFTSEPGADVPAYLCLPKNARPPYPTFICLQGHSGGHHNDIAVSPDDERTPIDVQGDRDFSLGCMKRGIAALAVEQRAIGQRRERPQSRNWTHGCHDAAMRSLMIGRTLAGERVYDVDRALDLLAQRPEIDSKRIGVMGNSGGGTVSMYAAALLSRLSYAMPSCSFCTFADSILSIYHCADNYIPALARYAEASDVMGLFAPRPLVIVAGQTDPIFPIKAVRKAFKNLQAIYQAAGAQERCKLVVGPEGHRFYADLAWKKMLPLMNKSL